MGYLVLVGLLRIKLPRLFFLIKPPKAFMDLLVTLTISVIETEHRKVEAGGFFCVNLLAGKWSPKSSLSKLLILSFKNII